jgi:uncharacterized membrane protein YeaQ/YmgE (transglycosylase-associated protein family)
MFKMMGFGDVNSVEAWTIMLAAIALSLIVGWLLDMIAEHIGFGIFGNAAIALIGAAVGLIVFRNYVGEVSGGRLPIVIGFAMSSVVVHMFVLVMLRRMLRL